jgi:hypothetical protein
MYGFHLSSRTTYTYTLEPLELRADKRFDTIDKRLNTFDERWKSLEKHLRKVGAQLDNIVEHVDSPEKRPGKSMSMLGAQVTKLSELVQELEFSHTVLERLCCWRVMYQPAHPGVVHGDRIRRVGRALVLQRLRIIRGSV